MPNYPSLSWYLADRIILVTYPSTFTEPDLKAITDATPVLRMLNQSEADLVHIMQDFTACQDFRAARLDRFIEINKHPSRAAIYGHARLGWIVDIAPEGALIRHLDAIVTQMFKVRYRAVTTLDEALTFLHRADPSLPPVAEH